MAHWRDYMPLEALAGSAVRTQFRAGDQKAPGFMVADLTGSPLEGMHELALLFAAAPELAEALKNAAEVLEIAESYLGYAPDSLGALDLAEAIETARAALAKAGVQS